MSANSRNAASAAITGWGHALPKALVTSESLEQVHGLSPGSLVASTGVKTRYIADRMGAESQLELGLRAARSALERADISAQSLVTISCLSLSFLFHFV
mgnify:CR=1 FL=1